MGDKSVRKVCHTTALWFAVAQWFTRHHIVFTMSRSLCRVVKLVVYETVKCLLISAQLGSKFSTFNSVILQSLHSD